MKSHGFRWAVKNKTSFKLRCGGRPAHLQVRWTDTFGALSHIQMKRGFTWPRLSGETLGLAWGLGRFQLFNTLLAFIVNSRCLLCAALMNRTVMGQGKSVWVTPDVTGTSLDVLGWCQAEVSEGSWESSRHFLTCLQVHVNIKVTVPDPKTTFTHHLLSLTSYQLNLFLFLKKVSSWYFPIAYHNSQ